MSVRLRDISVVIVGLAAGVALSPGTVSGEAGRVLATFLGLLSAGLLPTVTLLINSMSSTGRSVQEIQQLENELQAAIDVIFLLFGCILISIGALVSLSIKPAAFLVKIPYLTTEVLPRIGQALVVGPAVFVLWRAGTIPAVMRRALEIKRDIAIDESRKKILDRTPNYDTLREGYATHEDFGRVVVKNQPKDDV